MTSSAVTRAPGSAWLAAAFAAFMGLGVPTNPALAGDLGFHISAECDWRPDSPGEMPLSALYCPDASGAKQKVRLPKGFNSETIDRAEGGDVASRVLVGLFAFRAHKFDVALYEFQRSAAAGNIDAMNNLGYMSRNGIGLPPDQGSAMSWYRQTAEHGNSVGMRELGQMLLNENTPSAKEEGLSWLNKAGNAGDCSALMYLAIYYENGRTKPPNPEVAKSFHDRMAKKNCPPPINIAPPPPFTKPATNR